jgi:hypothetical protein
MARSSIFGESEHEWRQNRRGIEEALDVWSHDDETQREFRQYYWREIAEATDRYLTSLRELEEAIAEVTRRLPCSG